MDKRIEQAVLNNINWCGIVCNSQDIRQRTREHVWGLLSKAPPFYPDIITSSRNATVEEVDDFIGGRDISSIKDSYANLDLSLLGFKILFEAEWIYHNAISDITSMDTGWKRVKTEKDLTKWTIRHGLENVIRPELLKREDLRIFSYEKEGKTAGFIANLGANVVGISNVFSMSNDFKHLWKEITNIVAFNFPGVPMAGYEHGDNLTAAIQSGWTSIGPLRVWHK
jgi:hypothetical protein